MSKTTRGALAVPALAVACRSVSPLDLPVPDNEAERLRALDEYQIVGTEPVRMTGGGALIAATSTFPQAKVWGTLFDPADRNSILVRRYVEGQAAAAATKAH